MNRCLAISSTLLSFTLLSATLAFGQEDVIAYAESGGIPEVAAEATILDADGNVVREGSNGWTCMAVPGMPMCLDEEWMAFVRARASGDETFVPAAVGLGYMLQGDTGVSNIDPFAHEPTPDNDWVVTGPHLMLITPDTSTLAGIPADPSGGGPYVMWPDTPFAHVMIPIEANAVEMPMGGM